LITKRLLICQFATGFVSLKKKTLPIFFTNLVLTNLFLVKWNKPEVGGIIPTRRYGHTATVVNNKIFIFGGYDEKHNRLNEVYAFDPGMARRVI